MSSVQPALNLPRALVCSKRSGGRPTTQSFVLVDYLSSFRPHRIFLPTRRAVSAIHGVPIPQNARRRHPATWSDTSQLSDHGQSFRSNAYARLSFTLSSHSRSVSLTVFDRMFSLGLRGSGLNTTPLAAQSGTTAQTGPRRHFLYCALKPETFPHTKRPREISTVIS